MEVERKEIDGTLYGVDKFNAIKGIRVQTKLAKLLGGSIGALSSGGMEKALEILSSNMDDDGVLDLLVMLFDSGVTEIKSQDGHEIPKKVSLDTHFKGEYITMWKVAFFILEVNFGDVAKKLMSNSHIKEALANL